MTKERNVSKKIIVNKNEVKVDMKLETNQMILCGTCMRYSKEKECIVGVSDAKICIFNNYKKIKQIRTDHCGNYYTTIPKTKEYIICVCKNNKRQKKTIICNNTHFYMKHFIFDKKLIV